MPTISSFTKVLGQTLADATDICHVTATGATGKIGFTLGVVQTSGTRGVNRTYRVEVPSNATGQNWKRLAPYDRTEKFPAQNHWAVDLQSVSKATTLRLVRAKSGDPASTTSLSCKVIAYASVGEIIEIENATATASGVSNAGVFEGAVLIPMEGKLAINSDDPNHTLDVTGNVNATDSYKILGADVISANTLGPSITESSLTTVGTLNSLSIAGNLATSGNVSFTGKVSAATVSANTLTGTLLTSAQPNVTTVGTLGSLQVGTSTMVQGNLATANTTFEVSPAANRVLLGGYGVWTVPTQPTGSDGYIFAIQAWRMATGYLWQLVQWSLSPDGITWTVPTDDPFFSFNSSATSVAYGNGVFVAMIFPTVATSSDQGRTWSLLTTESFIGPIPTALSGVTYGLITVRYSMG